jgi:hypothetical protein
MITEDISLGDDPILFKEYIKDAEFLGSLKDVEFCINHPWQYKPSIIHKKLSNTVPLKTDYSVWYNKDIPNKRQVLDFVQSGHNLLLEHYSVHSNVTQQLCSRIEDILNVSCDMQLQCSLGATNNYSQVSQYSMFVVQIEGETSWKVFDKDATLVYNNKVNEESTTSIDSILRPGDMLYIPEGTVYDISPFEKYISASIYCSSNSNPIDRRDLKLNEK